MARAFHYLIEIGGAKALIDPVWAEQASPFTWADLSAISRPPAFGSPEIDVILISHDLRHLDYETVLHSRIVTSAG